MPELAIHPQRTVRSLLPWIEAACLMMLAGLLLWKGVLPAWRSLNTDFPNYYLVARLLREGYSLDRIYDWVWLQRIKDHWGLDQSLVGFAGLTPFSALPVVPLSIFPALVAKRLWILANLIFLGATVELLNQVTSLGRRRIWLLCLLAIFPLRTSFLYGQMHLLLLLLVTLAYFFHRRRSATGTGVCLSLAGALKVYPILFVGYFLWKRQWRPALTTACATVVIVGIGLLWMGGSILRIYGTQVLPRSLAGEVLDPYNTRASSGAALFHRLLIFEPALNPAPLLNSPSLYAALYPLWQLAILLPLLVVLRVGYTERQTEQLEWAAYLFVLLLLSPVPSSYHFVVMIFSIVLLTDVLWARKRYGAVALAVVLYSLISTIEFSPVSATPSFSFARLWIGLLFAGLCVFCLWTDRTSPTSLRADGARVALLCGVFAVVWISGLLTYHRHFAGFEQDLRRRLPASVPTYLARDLHPTPGGYIFTAMLPTGYRVLDQTGREVWMERGRAPADQLSAAAAESASVLVIELADATGSRIMTLASAAPFPKDPEAGMTMNDGESPALSPDGQSMAFLRETRGKGALWIAHAEDRRWGSPIRLVAGDYDVRNVTFTQSGRLVFAAKWNGRIGLFSFAPGTQRPGSEPSVFWAPGADVASPAVSPDGRFVAFTRLVQNRWQLGYMDAATRQAKMLTFGDCNASGPSWFGPSMIGYASDCGRGLGLTALATIRIDR